MESTADLRPAADRARAPARGLTLVATVAEMLADRPQPDAVQRALELLRTHGVRPMVDAQTGEVRVTDHGDLPAQACSALESLFTLAARHSEGAGAPAAPEVDLQAIVDALDTGVLVRTDAGHVLNAAGRKLLGLEDGTAFDPARFMPRTVEGEPLEAVDLPSVHAHARGKPVAYQLRIATRGTDRIVDGVAAPIVRDGVPLGHVVFFRDVTDEHDARLLAEGVLDRVFSALPLPVVSFEPGSFRVLTVNRAFRELVGYSSADLVGLEPPLPWCADAPRPPVEERLGSGDVACGEDIFRRKDGSLVPVSFESMTLRDAGGEPARVVAVFADRTERVRFEQQLVQSGKMAALGELAAGVAHEINNPLFAILGIVEFLVKDAEPGTKTYERLRLVHETGLEIKEIVRALLDFARERSDQFAAVDLRDVARGTVELLRRASSAKGVEIVERYDAERVPVEASRNQLKQVVLNLLANARQAMPNGGIATVEVARRDGRAALTVSDTGPGVPPEVAGRVFEPFFTTKRDIGGTGLGLSVSLGIAHMHGGDLELSHAPGGGAAFTLCMPVARESE